MSVTRVTAERLRFPTNTTGLVPHRNAAASGAKVRSRRRYRSVSFGYSGEELDFRTTGAVTRIAVTVSARS